MALFQHNDLLVPYRTQFAPFAFDLILLQGSRFNADYWIPVLEQWKDLKGEGGRILTLDWPPAGLIEAERASAFVRLIQTLGLHDLHVVACDDAVEMIEQIAKDFPGLIEKTLLFPRNPPRGESLFKAVSEFTGVAS